MLPSDCQTVRNACLWHILTWRVPPHWSFRDWREEVEAIADAAFWQASYDFDPARGVPFCLFMRQRILSNALTRYRQEWAYALHCVPLPDEEGNKSLTDSVLISTPVDEELRYALLYLSPRNYWLIVQLFWEERTEAEIGVTLGISQRGVSKHKQAALTDLRGRLETSEKN